jgi:hypothetical protein
MSQKIIKYIEFLKNPTNYINDRKNTCNAINILITEIDAMLNFVDTATIHHINSLFPQIKHIKCGSNLAALLTNTQFVNINELAKLLVVKYLYIFNSFGYQEQPNNTNNDINCDNIKDVIDNAVKDISLNKALNNNLFSSVPIKYKEDISDYKQNLVSSLSDKLQPTIVFSDRDLENITDKIAIIDKSAITVELFNQKKKFADEITKIMSGEYLFNDDNQDIINNFQYLINKMFNDKILEYIKSKGFREDAIFFIYKGGTTMKIIYDKYKSILKQNKKIFDDNIKYFSRSDSDYGIFINQDYFNTFDSYNKILCDINKIAFEVLTRVQEVLSENLKCICPLDNVSQPNLEKLLNNFNNILNAPDRDTSLPDFKDVKKIIGITFNNTDYFTDKIPKGLLDSQIHILETKSNTKFYVDFEIDKISKRQQLKQNGKIESNINNFIIKIHKNNTPGMPEFSPAIYNLNTSNPNGIYYYLNETNKFMGNGLLTEFNLHRLKINAVLYYITINGEYGYFNCPSELVDVSISNFYDGKIQNLDLNRIIKKYKNNKVEFNSYTLYGFIDDIYKGIFYETKYPWDAVKYEKKIYRVIILLFIYINNKYNNTKVLYDAIFKLFNNLSNDIVGNIDSIMLEDKATGNKQPVSSDTLIYKLLSNISSRYNSIKTEPNSTQQANNMNELRKMIKIINDIVIIFKPEDVNSGYNDNIEEVPFLDKYLKYKTKYYALLKKLGKI